LINMKMNTNLFTIPNLIRERMLAVRSSVSISWICDNGVTVIVSDFIRNIIESLRSRVTNPLPDMRVKKIIL